MKTKCMSCGGSMKKMAVGGTTTKRIIKKSTGGMYGIPQENLGTSGQYGFAKKGGATKKYQNGGYTVTNADGSSYSSPANQQGFKKSEKKYGPALSIEDLVKDSKNQDRLNKKRTAAGAAGMFIFKKQNKPVYTTEPKMKKGGATKAAKFAALAPPYNKATFADRIVGAKKSAGSKKLPKAQFGAFIKAFSKVVKPASKIVKPVTKIVKPASKIVKPVAKRVATTSKKNIPKKIDFRNTKNGMDQMLLSYFKKQKQRDQILNLVNKNKN